MTIKSDIKEKVIQLAREGKGRNQIVNEMNGVVSFGSVSNILKESRQHEQLQVNTQPLQPVYSSIDQSVQPVYSSGPQPEQQSNTTISNISDNITAVSPILHGTGLDSKIVPKDGGPLSHLLKTDDSVIAAPTTKPELEFVDFDNKPYPYPYPYPNIKPSSINYDVVKEDENVEEEKGDKQYHQSRFPTYTSKNQGPSIKPPIDLGIDLDSAWESGFINYIKTDKQERQKELQLIEQRELDLRQREQQISEMMQIIDQRNNDLKARESKLDEIKPLLPSVLELQENGITFDTMMSYLLAINAKAALENTDLKTAAYTMKEEFKAYHNLQDLRRVIKNEEKYLADMGNSIRQNERAILTIIELRKLGYTEKNIRDLVALVSAWHEGLPGLSCRKLDTVLIDVGTKGNLQQQSPGNGGPSMKDYLRLQLLQASTSNILNKMGVKN